MTNLYVRETYVNRTAGYRFGDSGDNPQESFTDSAGELYRSLVKEYGRCEGRMYHDRKDRPPIACGWVFVGRQRYEDARRGENGRYPASAYYVRETWVELHDAPPEHTTTYHLHDLDGKRAMPA